MVRKPSRKATRPHKRAPNLADLPPPLVPPDVDLRDVPFPIPAFIELAMSQWGISREEATRLVLETVAEHHGAKGTA